MSGFQEHGEERLKRNAMKRDVKEFPNMNTSPSPLSSPARGEDLHRDSPPLRGGCLLRYLTNEHLGIIHSERGIALVMVLILSAISLAIMAALVYMITAGTQISGVQKRYRTALEAGLGGKDITYQVLAARGDPQIDNINFLINPNIGGCLATKLNLPTSGWGACNSSMSINPAGDLTSYDFSFQLQGINYFGVQPIDYIVYSKIVDTVEGNSGGDIGLTKGGVVNTNSGEVSMVSIPYLYTIEVEAENAANRAERAKLSILYQY